MNQAAKSVFAVFLGMLVTLAAVTLLIIAALRVAEMPHSPARTLATAGELILGALLLVGAVYLALQVAVWVLGKRLRS